MPVLQQYASAPAVAMKCTLGENPKFAYEKGEVNTRLGIVSKLREALIGTSEYIKRKEDSESESKKPPFDMKYEALIPVMKKEMPLKFMLTGLMTYVRRFASQKSLI